MRLFVLSLVLVAACDGSRFEDVVGPFTGESRRFVVDSIRLPRSNAEVRGLAGYLDDGAVDDEDAPDNMLGSTIVTLGAVADDITHHGDEIINGGAIASSVVITADDFTNDPTVSVLYLGDDDDTTGVLVGGQLTDGVFEPNRTRWTHVAGAATLHLPVFVDGR